MAQRVQVLYSDDIDGSEADGTITFGFEGVQYEIDLSEKNRAKLEKALGPYISNARRVGGRNRRGSRKDRVAAGDAKSIRSWAQENGYDVPDRGRIPGSVREAYAAVHG